MSQRPELIQKSAGAASTGKSWNPIANWLAKRKENRIAAEEEASRLITNKMAENELAIIRKLESINFATSRLPKEVLEKKTNPAQPYGDLELAARGFATSLRKHPQVIKMDIRKFDEKLMTLVLLFKQAVEQGDERAAYAAKGGIYRAIQDIRSRIPENQPELAKMFVEANTQYMDQWITLTCMGQTADRYKQNADRQRKRYEEDMARDQRETEKLRQDILNDAEKAIAFKKLMKYETSSDRDSWTPVEREVYLDMLNKRMATVHTKLNNALLLQSEQDLATTVGRLEILYAKVASLEIVVDPNLMSKFKESVDQIFQKLAESDARIDETFKFMDEIEGRLQQLDNAPGAQRAREVAAEEAENTYEKIMKLQDVDSKNNELEAAKLRKDLGILDDEQLKLLRQQAEEEQRLQMELWREQLRQEAEERQAELQENLNEEREEQRTLIPN